MWGKYVYINLSTDNPLAFDFDIRRIANYICKHMETGKYKFLEGSVKNTRRSEDDTTTPLIRITTEDVFKWYKGKEVKKDKACTMTWWIRWQYVDMGVKSLSTQWMCGKRKMPLCQEDCTNGFRYKTCLDGHQCSLNIDPRCFKVFNNRIFPEHLKVFQRTRTKSTAKAVMPPNSGKRPRLR